MLRFLVLLVLILLVWRGTMLLLERAGVGRLRGDGRTGPAAGEELVRCAVCSTRIPASRALTAGGRRLCSPACRDAAGGLAD
ncbi:MAG TPA: PP0621 family protein [Thermoanaerobaculia bacterium]|nr:PP0621 family protein [Thermoanaerobaculia bacterium]